MQGDSRASLPVVEPPFAGEPVDDPIVIGVLLAAGDGSRFDGEEKLLATLDDEPIVFHAGRTLAFSNLDSSIAVVDPTKDIVKTHLARLGIQCVQTEATDPPLSSTIYAGIDAVRDRADAVVVALGDMPSVAPQTVRTLIEAYRTGVGTAFAAGCDGQRGNPVLFDARYFEDLLALDGEQGGRAVLFDATDSAIVETNDPGVHVDVDTRADLERLRSAEDVS